ncbi:hypothetical protein [Kistimonas asteriae]|uniref:hypothetical protein n=1 Tax=Kistimonas asteriae TaxID=517724 RepID=UPI001BA5F53B|nr:hypothetical protein [Kistimonas asteriae]
MAQMRHLAEQRDQHQRLIRMLDDSSHPGAPSEPVCNGLTLANGLGFSHQVSAVKQHLGGILDRNEKTSQQLRSDALRLKRQAEVSEQRLECRQHRRCRNQLNRVMEEVVCRWVGGYD